MKDDTSQGKKSQRDDRDLQKDEEEMDFEILDALEQLENDGLPSGEDLSGDENMIELTVDDDMIIDEDDAESSGGFKFDANVSANLEEELLSEDVGGNFDASFSSDLPEGVQATPDEPFSIDLREEDIPSGDEMGLDLDDPGVDMPAVDTRAFQFNHEETPETEEIEISPTIEGEEGMAPGEYDLEFDGSPAVLPSGEEIGEGLDYAPGGDAFEEEEPEEFDLSPFDSESGLSDEFDLGDQEIEIEKEFSDLKDEIDLDLDNFQGKTVISVGDDEVIDLGDVDDFERDESDAVMDSLETDEMPELRDELESPDGEKSLSDVFLDLHEEEEEEELAEDFMQSLGAIDLDLEEDADDESEITADDEIISEEIPADGEQEGTEMGLEEADPLEPPDIPDLEEDSQDLAPDTESEEEFQEPEIDVREFLGLTLRLDDANMQEFETMVQNAETLQQYLTELDEHQETIKENIFHKLHAEYIARKTAIFKSSEFITLLADVEQDLTDMLDTQAEFTATLDRKNEELEEIKVRHLVGEYDGSTLADKEQEQRADIAVWNEKAEKITEIIVRYQNAIDVERELNPLRQEEEQQEPTTESPSLISEEGRSEDSSSALEEPEQLTEEERASAPLSEEEESNVLSEAIDTTPSGSEDDMAERESGAVFEEDESDGPVETLLEETPVKSDDEKDGDGEFYSFGEDIGSFDASLALDGEFELEDLPDFDDEDEEFAVSYEIEALAKEESVEDDEQGTVAEEMISCNKCGRQTPVDEKFCVHCGGKPNRHY